jgi:hypothetical protein
MVDMDVIICQKNIAVCAVPYVGVKAPSTLLDGAFLLNDRFAPVRVLGNAAGAIRPKFQS